jgi:hypothetical protein
VALGFAPLPFGSKVLDTVDVVFLVGELLGMVDPYVPELRHIDHIIAPEAISVNHAVMPDFLADN